MKDLFRKYILPIILAAILYPYIRTLRVRIVDSSLRPLKKGHLKSYIYAHYHEDIPVVALHHAYANTICTMASRSKDGELISRVLTLLGFKMVRGSTRHFGAQVLGQIQESFHQGKTLAWAVDGPKGPRHQVKEGVVFLAKKFQKPIVPVAAASQGKWVFQKSWDQMWFPYPFSKTVIVFGDPILESTTAEHIQMALADLKQKATSYLL
ncbi:MAG: hypothetical protein A3B70_08435 [Deltaproteobacteria bacterium RIFCSPHIGHO2_02_FULL_40_11]|nr:MAG: hypothetical protein A3B70_08435 [Deltaproteobacteria bacterium RIFCSPHIGHO2_02_FULL_40_11]